MNELIIEKVHALSNRYGEMSDEELLSIILSGSDRGEAVFYLLYGRYFTFFENLRYRLCASKECLPDLMAELELHLLDHNCKAFHSFHGESSFKSWLITVAHNLFINKLPKIESLYSEKEELNERWMPESIIAYKDIDTITTFRQALCNLPSVEQRIVLMKEVEGYNAKEIADMLTARRAKDDDNPRQKSAEVSVDNVYKIRQRAVASLKDLLRKEHQRIAEEEQEIRFRCDEVASNEEEYRYKAQIITKIYKIKEDIECIVA